MQRGTRRLIVFDHSGTCIGNNTKCPKFTAHPSADKFADRSGLKFPLVEDITVFRSSQFVAEVKSLLLTQGLSKLRRKMKHGRLGCSRRRSAVSAVYLQISACNYLERKFRAISVSPCYSFERFATRSSLSL